MNDPLQIGVPGRQAEGLRDKRGETTTTSGPNEVWMDGPQTVRSSLWA